MLIRTSLVPAVEPDGAVLLVPLLPPEITKPYLIKSRDGLNVVVYVPDENVTRAKDAGLTRVVDADLDKQVRTRSESLEAERVAAESEPLDGGGR